MKKSELITKLINKFDLEIINTTKMSKKIKLTDPLPIESIDFRVQSINGGGYATILAYKDARVDMQRLDDAVGYLNWKREHTRDNKNCVVSIYDHDKKEWISKEDTGTESFTEAEKGLASDSFKRACFNWGIGRELYDYPSMQIKLKECSKDPSGKYTNDGEYYLYKDNNGKSRAKQTFNLNLKKWKWISEFKDGVICALACKDAYGKVRFNWGEFTKK